MDPPWNIPHTRVGNDNIWLQATAKIFKDTLHVSGVDLCHKIEADQVMVRLKLPNFPVLRPVVQFFQATSFYQAVQFKAHLTLMKILRQVTTGIRRRRHKQRKRREIKNFRRGFYWDQKKNNKNLITCIRLQTSYVHILLFFFLMSLTLFLSWLQLRYFSFCSSKTRSLYTDLWTGDKKSTLNLTQANNWVICHVWLSDMSCGRSFTESIKK